MIVPNYYEVIDFLKNTRGYTLTEIAERTGMSLTTIKRAKNKEKISKRAQTVLLIAYFRALWDTDDALNSVYQN